MAIIPINELPESNVIPIEQLPDKQTDVAAEQPPTESTLKRSVYGTGGQIAGGVAGGIIGATLGHPHVGSAVGGTAGRAIGLLEEEKQKRLTPDYIKKHPIISTLMNMPQTAAVPPTMAVSPVATLISMDKDERKEFTKEMKTTAAIEAAFMPISFGLGKAFEAVGRGISAGVGKTKLHKVVTTVKGKMVDYLKGLNKSYGQQLDDIIVKAGGEGMEINTENFLNSMKKRLFGANVIDDAGEYIGVTAKDKSLYNWYKMINEGKAGKITYQTIKNLEKSVSKGFSKATQSGKQSITEFEHLLSGLKHDVALLYEDVGMTGLRELNKWYAPKRQLFEAGNKIFKPFTDVYTTKSGVKALSSFYDDIGTQNMMKDLSKLIGYDFVSTAKNVSNMKSMMSTPLVLTGGSVGKMLEGAFGLGRAAVEAAPKAITAGMPAVKAGVTQFLNKR